MFLIGKNVAKVKEKTETTIKPAVTWLKSKGLQIAPHKTETMVVRGPSSIGSFGIEVEGVEIKAKNEVKYLGVTYSKNLNFANHVIRVT